MKYPLHDGLLDSSGKIVSSLLPSFVDDVLEFPTFSGKIYIAVDTHFGLQMDRYSGYANITNPIVVDLVLSTTSDNPVANRIITARINELSSLLDNLDDDEYAKLNEDNEFTGQNTFLDEPVIIDFMLLNGEL